MKRLYHNMDKILLWSCLILFTLGITMIISASAPVRFLAENSTNVFKYAYSQLGFGIVSVLLAYILIIKRPIRKTFGLATFGIWSVVIMLVLVILVGDTVNNSKSWLNIFGLISVQPSEFAKPAVILYLAYLANYFKNNDVGVQDYVWKFSPVVVTIILILAQPDKGTAIIVAFITLLIFLVMPIAKELKKKILLIIGGVIICLGLVLLVSGRSPISNETANRLNYENIVNPCKDYYNEGLQVCNSLIAVNNSNGWGRGFYKSTQKYLYLPYGYTDFIMAITIEELGLIGFTIIMLLYAIILIRLIVIAKKSRNIGNAIIGYGVAIYIAIHICFNLGGILGMIPLTGVPLPFLTSGGSYLASLIAAIALAERVAHDNKLGV